MSVTFQSNVTSFETSTKAEPCLCAQGADGFFAMMRGEDSDEIRASLKADATPACPFCQGTGVEVLEQTDAPMLNLANDNAKRLLAVLGVPFDYAGEMAVADARRALMRARARVDLTPFEREAETVYGAPRADEYGVVELRPLRLSAPALTADDLRDRVERFAAFVEESAARGATEIRWD